MNYQTFSNQQFRSLLKNFFHIVHIDLRGTSSEKRPFVPLYLSVSLVLLWCSKKSPISISSLKDF